MITYLDLDCSYGSGLKVDKIFYIDGLITNILNCLSFAGSEDRSLWNRLAQLEMTDPR